MKLLVVHAVIAFSQLKHLSHVLTQVIEHLLLSDLLCCDSALLQLLVASLLLFQVI